MEWLANLSSHTLNRKQPMVQYQGFGITITHFSSTGKRHLNSKPKTLDKVE
jgi:hypothetical protein